jgi:type IV pilus biogenesis protein CpaD/CtpE
MKKRLISALILLLLAGCASAPTIQSPLNPVAYAPAPASAHIADSAIIEVTYNPAPEIQSKWRQQGFKDKVIERHRLEVINALTNDVANSGIFTRIVAATSDAHPDYTVKVQCRTVQSTTYTSAQISLTIINSASGSPEWSFFRDYRLGPINGPHKPLPQALSHLMASLKSDLANAIARKAKADAEHTEITNLKTAPLSDLLIASDRNTTIARERNRAIVAAKNEQLPGILRSWKTDQLSALVVKIEQTILDLNHECELAKDKAQQSVAEGTSQNADTDVQSSRMNSRGRGLPAATGQSRDTTTNSVDAQRDLSISYRERIELLKPILTALKEEIANRNR